MTNITYDRTGVHVQFPGWEATMTGLPKLLIPRSAIRGVASEQGWTSEILGMKSGLVISGYRKLGTFRHPSGVRRLVSMKRGHPLLRITVDRAAVGFDEILLSTDAAESIAADLRSDVHS
ncbi:hypothetical protein CFK41_09065 [Brachybacterium ginsengisoli]|jgi:hypothetical protein|uniref:Bacterial Pleckstrin homology domain-containing protein n=1 Tax=Brachybacterium ginsengisoli TaxID=1331682 RepID=A0A291GXG2_9MICO|nr:MULTISPECIES: hypothetical protein [Micrococcales]ATG54895.1 hypothetical protein CFK41_09065 [Brachybacterium ginsengisoli]RYF58633.1 MAG: hypothetical protein EOO27_11935 [Comamonadaceae bacterium]HWK77910.1 hypothetical protein [Microbacterium sp.]